MPSAVEKNQRPRLVDLLTSTSTQQVAWDELRQQWPRFTAQTSGGIVGNTGNRVIVAAGNFCSAEKEAEVRDFFTAHPVEGYKRPLTEALAKIHACTELCAEQQANLTTWTQANH